MVFLRSTTLRLRDSFQQDAALYGDFIDGPLLKAAQSRVSRRFGSEPMPARQLDVASAHGRQMRPVLAAK